MEQSRRPGGGVTAFSGNGQAMDKQPGQRQRDGQQQPGPQPGGKKNPHANVLPRSDVSHHLHGATRSAALQSPVPGHAPGRTTIAGLDGGSVTELNAGDGSWMATLTGGCYNFDSPRGIAVGGSHIWVASSDITPAGGSVTELNASNGSWIQTLSDGTWIQSLLGGCIPGVLASGGYHFSNPGLIAAVGTHICVFGSNGVTVLTAPVTRPGRGQRPGRQAGP